MAPLFTTLIRALGRRADRLARRRRGRRGGGVLELLLRAKERVEHLLAKVLGEGEREHRSHEQEQQQPAAPALTLLLRPAERVGRITQMGSRFLQLLLRLLVVHDGFTWALLTVHAPIRLAR